MQLDNSIRIGKEAKAASVDSMIIAPENLKESMEKLLQIIREFSKVTNYKKQHSEINDVIYTNNNHLEGIMREKTPFYNSKTK